MIETNPEKQETETQGDKGKELKRTRTSEELEAELKSGGFFGKNCYWITCSLLAGLFMGTGAAIFAVKYSELGFKGGGLTGPGVFIIFLLLWVFRESRYRIKNGRWTKPGKDSRLVWEDGKTKWSNLIPFLGNVTCNVSYLIVMTYAWEFAALGDINQGVVSALLALASLINVVTFYFGFGEKLSPLHLIGVVFMLASVICIGMVAGSHGGEVDSDDDLD